MTEDGYLQINTEDGYLQINMEVATSRRKWRDIYSREGTEEENDCIPQPISSIRSNA